VAPRFTELPAGQHFDDEVMPWVRDARMPSREEKRGEHEAASRPQGAVPGSTQLGYVVFERFAMLMVDVPDSDREALRERVKANLEEGMSDLL
jgi:hypothetical protein